MGLHSKEYISRVQRDLTAQFPSIDGSLLDLVRQLRCGDISPWEAANESIGRVERANELLNCFVTIGREQAETHAKSLEQSPRQERPLLWGVPMSVKDLAATSGLTTTFSSKAFANYLPSKDAPLVAAMKASGMTIIGKTNTPEFGALPVTESELNGICKNPWGLDWSVGGSSGGAAASVAAGLTPVAHGSDGAGSLRIPASCCGVFSVVLPHGRLPPSERAAVGRGPQDGVLSRTVADAIYYLAGLNAISEDEFGVAMEMASGSVQESILFDCSPPIDCPVDSACEEAVHVAAELLGASGCRVSARKLDWKNETILNDMMLLRSVIPVAFGDPAAELLDRTTRNAMRLAEEASAMELQRTYVRLQAYTGKILGLLNDDDILLTPVVARPTVPHGWITEPTDPIEVFRRSAEFAPFTAFVNLAGLCAISVPLGRGDDGVPVGVQLASRPNNLAKLLGLAARLERLAPWVDRKPMHFFG
ncbi:amidase [Burkholderia ubonensis]|uniref:amidase n=1 Tax=Burkholderia ubonensis TaxID=101571 RepID=UPI0009B3ED73|nr:amidase [Burkholderia ubonensis]